MRTLLLILTTLIACTAQAQNITAIEFFEPIRPEVSRNKNWPKRLHYKPDVIPVENLKELVRGGWKVMHACSGRPPERSKLVFSPMFSHIVIRFHDHRLFERLQFQLDSAEPKTQGPVPYTLTASEPEKGIVELRSPGLVTVEIRAAIIEETGEQVLIDSSDTIQIYYPGVCEKDERFEYVFVKEPVS